MNAYLYAMALAAISLLVLALEWRFPWRREQPLLKRRSLPSDLAHLIFNGHFLGVLLYGIAAHHVLPQLDRLWAQLGLTELVYRQVAAAWPLWAQIVVALLAVDLLQWGIHVTLHRVPWLWEFHKSHHSVVDGEMSWMASFRFQWAEVVVYKSLSYLPLAFFGFSPAAVMTHAIIGTLIGHLNHANLNVDWGPLRYLINSPRMHIWHHDYEADGRSTVNFGIIFSVWDWMFGTAKLPSHPPARIGFHGVEQYPRDFLSQMAWPLSARRTSLRWAGPVLGLGVLALGYWAHQPAQADHQQASSSSWLSEKAASSQPKTVHSDLIYPATRDEAQAALVHLGRDAAQEGYAHPEWLVSVPELAAALGAPKLVLLDVRSAEDYRRGHIASARHVSRQDFSHSRPFPGPSKSSTELQAMLRARGVSTEDQVVIYGDGPEAHRLWETLRTVGGFETRVLDGGIVRWKALGGALVEGEGDVFAPGNLSLAARPTPAHFAELTRPDQQGPIRYLDARTPAEFDGTRRHADATRAGHIPGAQSLPYDKSFRSPEDPRLLALPALRDLADSLTLAPDEPVVTYCQTGTRSAALLFSLLQAGVEARQLQNYDGSWAEYSRSNLPLETGSEQCIDC